ncbi:DUF917 domain-containing protein [Rhodococcus sp. NPDC059968]|uniref:DUF917 domain-containing protein n=2 Tax=Rhodococcus TaxID=1827 RepID=UPI00366B3A9D
MGESLYSWLTVGRSSHPVDFFLMVDCSRGGTGVLGAMDLLSGGRVLVCRIRSEDVEDLASGATVLGAGGGGDTWVTGAMLFEAIGRFGPIELIGPTQIGRDELVLTIGMVGAPAAILEQFPGPAEVERAIRALERILGQPCSAIMPLEMGGTNALFPLAASAWLGIPCVDADAMRRAFPHVDMTLLALEGIDAGPAAFTGCPGTDVVVRAPTNQGIEVMARACIREMGLVAVMAAYPMTGTQCRKASAHGSVTYCLELGRKLAAAAPDHPHALDDFLTFVHGRSLFEGVVVHVNRPVAGVPGSRGTVVLEHLANPDRLLRVEFQTENIVALEEGRAVVTTPDLIVALHLETNQPISTEAISPGHRARIIGIPAHPRWTTTDGISLAGPRSYGYDLDYTSFEQTCE